MKFERSLTAEGQKEIGHIFPNCVPLTQWTPCHANLQGQIKRVFLVKWDSLRKPQQELVLDYISKKNNNADKEEIRRDIEKAGSFPIRAEFILEVYSMRSFM